jgi:hypothetical protein
MQFVVEHVRMADAKAYLLDALSAYAALQTFSPQPSKNAVRFDGEMLLNHFGIRYQADR